MKSNLKSSGFSNSTKRKVKEFFIFLVLTSIIWLLMELSKTYTSSVIFKVTYKNLPSSKLFQSKPDSELGIALKAPGFSLLKYKIKRGKINLNLNKLIKTKSVYALLPNNQLPYLNAQLPSNIEIIKVLEDSITIDLGVNKSKKVPVKPNLKLNFKLGYGLTNTIKIIPDSILITGPKKNIDSITELNTFPIELKNINKNIHITSLIKLPSKDKNIEVNSNKVKIDGEVDKFTEGSFTIPVVIVNKPKKVEINTLPNTVEVIFQSGLTNYPKISSKSVLIVFDYNQYKKDTLIQYLTPIIKHASVA